MSEDLSFLDKALQRARERVTAELHDARGTFKSLPTRAQQGLDLKLHDWPLPNPLVSPPPVKKSAGSLLNRLKKAIEPAAESLENAARKTKAELDGLSNMRDKSSGAQKDPPGTHTGSIPIPIP